MQCAQSYEAPAWNAVPVLHAPSTMVLNTQQQAGRFFTPVETKRLVLVPKSVKSVVDGDVARAFQSNPPKFKFKANGDFIQINASWRLNVATLEEEKKDGPVKVQLPRFVTPWMNFIKVQDKSANKNPDIKQFSDQLVLGKVARFGENSHTSAAYGAPDELAAEASHQLDSVNINTAAGVFTVFVKQQLKSPSLSEADMKDYGNNLPSLLEAGDQMDGSSRSYVALPEFEGTTNYRVKMVTDTSITLGDGTRLRPSIVDDTNLFDRIKQLSTKNSKRAGAESYVAAMDGRWHVEFFASALMTKVGTDMRLDQLKSFGYKMVYTPATVFMCPVREYENLAGNNKAFQLINSVFKTKLFVSSDQPWSERWVTYVKSLRKPRTKRKSSGKPKPRKRVRQEDIPASQKGGLMEDMDEVPPSDGEEEPPLLD